MKRKSYNRLVAFSVSATVFAGSMGGSWIVSARDITGENLLVNADFEAGDSGWEFVNAGTGSGKGVGIGTNNPHDGKNHSFIDGAEGKNYSLVQEVIVPADGIYSTSAWLASGGAGAKFGIRTADGEVLKEVDIKKGSYQQYSVSDVELIRGQQVEVYVTEGTAWINGDDFSMSCTEQTGDTDEYIFEGNMVTNGDFNDEMNGWNVEKGGTATNNGYPAGDKHYYLDQGGSLEQEIEVPYTGNYKASTWVSTGGKGSEFGIKAEDGNVLTSVEMNGQKEYQQYELEVRLKKGDKVTIYVQGGSSWTNGDKFSFTYNKTEFGNMLINSDFQSEEAWMAKEANVGGGRAELMGEQSEISQNFYVPVAGPYIAEVQLENAENAVVTLGQNQSKKISGNQMVTVKMSDLKVGQEVTAKVSGKATVTSFTVKFDSEEFNNQAPAAENVTVGSDPEIGAVLSGNYEFLDNDGHKEGDSHYQWYVSGQKDGEYIPIEGADEKTFTLTDDYRDKYIKFEVTPVDEYMGVGEKVSSEPIGPVYLNVVENGGFESGTGSWKEIEAEKTTEEWTHQGIYRGKLTGEETGYQTVSVPESGYYDMSVWLRCPDETTKGKISVKDQAGNVIKESGADGLTGEWKKYEVKDILLEAGTEVQVCITAGNQTLYVDDVVMKAQREKDIPAFANIKTFVTDPSAYETIISPVKHEVILKYYYDTDLSSVRIEEMNISDGAKASANVGDTLDLTKEYQIKVENGDGQETIWTVKAEEAEKKVVVHSSNKYLEDTFNWAAQKQRQFVMTGQRGPINVPQESGQEADYIPSYWAGYYDRTAFYARDFVHQATGGQIAGLEEENFNMFKAFAKQCTEERQWYTVWALNFDGSVYTMDYKSPTNFVREVPAQFELVEKAYKQYLWSGDERYINDPDLWNFYTNVMTKYADSHDANGNGVVQEVGTGIFNGSCTYNERGRHVIEAGDAIGSQYQATLAYAAMLEARGEKAESEEWYQKAEELKKYFNEEWSVSDDQDSEYVCAWGPNGERYSDFSKETSWFIPLKLIAEPGERCDSYIDFILENLGDGIGTTPTAPHNLEAYTYIPDMLFLYNRSDDAWKWMKYITSIKDEPHERPIQGTNGDYPEISFTFVSHTIEGMMGVEPDARRDFIATVPRLPEEVPDVTANHIDIGDSELSLTHVGNDSSALTNVSGADLTWEARFYGDYQYIKIGDEYVKAQQKDLNGERVSYVQTSVPQGETVNAQAVNEIPAAEYVISAEAGENGKITPSGEITVGENETQTFVMQPDEGYKVEDVLVDGESVGAVTEYEFRNVTADHTIKVTFEQEEAEPGDGGDDGDDGSGGDSGNGGDTGNGGEQENSGNNGSNAGSGTAGDNNTAVKTGDVTQSFMYAIFGMFAGAAAGAAAWFRKKKR